MEQIGFVLRTFASGFQIDSANFENETNDEEVDITLKFSDQMEFTQDIDTLNVVGPTGEQIPLTSLGT